MESVVLPGLAAPVTATGELFVEDGHRGGQVSEDRGKCDPVVLKSGPPGETCGDRDP